MAYFLAILLQLKLFFIITSLFSKLLYEENTKEISGIYVKKCFSKFLPDFYGIENVDLQDNCAIEIMKLIDFDAFKKLAARVLWDLNHSTIVSRFRSIKILLFEF